MDGHLLHPALSPSKWLQIRQDRVPFHHSGWGLKGIWDLRNTVELRNIQWRLNSSVAVSLFPCLVSKCVLPSTFGITENCAPWSFLWRDVCCVFLSLKRKRKHNESPWKSKKESEQASERESNGIPDQTYILEGAFGGMSAGMFQLSGLYRFIFIVSLFML